MTSPCAVCGEAFGGVDALAVHLVAEAERSDVRHVMWLNRNVTKHRTSPEELAALLNDGGAEEQERDRVRR